MPFTLYDYQEAWVNAFADCGAAEMYFQVGAGKTLAATVAALYHRLHHPGHTVVLMPPILLRQWDKWLKSIKGVDSVLMYRGTPAERAKLDLNADFVLMSMDIFKRDFDQIYDFFVDRNATLIVDEAVFTWKKPFQLKSAGNGLYDEKSNSYKLSDEDRKVLEIVEQNSLELDDLIALVELHKHYKK